MQLDPRIRIAPAALALSLTALTRQTYNAAADAYWDYVAARAQFIAAAGQLAHGSEVDKFKDKVEAIAPAPGHGDRGVGPPGRGEAEEARTLDPGER